jgi:predicted lipoprotein with Yx(FWY)xxD motif
MDDETISQPFTRHLRHVVGRRFVWTAAFTAVGLFVAACSGGGSKIATVSAQPSGAAAVPHSASGSTTTATVVEMTSAKWGRILTDAKGFVLYTYTADKPGGPGCHGSCLVLWPPLLLPAGVAQPIGGAGVTQLGTLTRTEGIQVTYRGLPLYTYLDDKQPGQITGEDVVDAGGTWLLATLGSPGAAPSGPAATSPPATHSGGPGSPAAQPSVPNAPPTQPPATQPPATQPPATSPPPTRPPTTAPPTTAPGGGVSY